MFVAWSRRRRAAQTARRPTLAAAAVTPAACHGQDVWRECAGDVGADGEAVAGTDRPAVAGGGPGWEVPPRGVNNQAAPARVPANTSRASSKSTFSDRDVGGGS